MLKSSKIYVAGHRGMVGAAVVRKLSSEGYTNLIFRTSSELDLRNQSEVNKFFDIERPEFVFLAAAKVGGIHANNTYRADFIYDNLAIQTNIIHSSWTYKVKKLLFLGSSCIYPKNSPQPIKEEYLLTAPLEPTNEPYAIAKITGIKLCEAFRSQYGCNFISVMPTNLYGQGDNFDLKNSHVLPALLRKIHEAKINQLFEVEIWGTGNPRREFLHADDLAEACLFLMMNYNESNPINIGTGSDISILELAELIKNIIGYQGTFKFNSAYPDGTFRKLLDVSKLNNLGWKHKIELADGISKVYDSELKGKLM